MPVDQKVKKGVITLAGTSDPDCHETIGLLLPSEGWENMSKTQRVHWDDFQHFYASDHCKQAIVASMA